jgi:hypothetical protein
MSPWLYGIRGAAVVATIAGLLGITYVYVWGDWVTNGVYTGTRNPVEIFIQAAFVPTLVYLLVARHRGELPMFPRRR